MRWLLSTRRTIARPARRAAPRPPHPGRCQAAPPRPWKASGKVSPSTVKALGLLVASATAVTPRRPSVALAEALPTPLVVKVMVSSSSGPDPTISGTVPFADACEPR